MRVSLFFILTCWLMFLIPKVQAQIVKPGDWGKTYYDSTYTRICEIFHHDVRYLFMQDTVNGQNRLKEILIIKNGPYVSYFPDGSIEMSGFFLNNDRDSTWTFYDHRGVTIRTEKYKNGILQE